VEASTAQFDWESGGKQQTEDSKKRWRVAESREEVVKSQEQQQRAFSPA
jgi:hypothetical protein